MTVEQKHSNLLAIAQSQLGQLSPDKLELVVAFLAYLQEREKTQAIEELSSIPDFTLCVGEIENNTSHLIADDAEVWEAYLKTEQKWEEVYRRLADS
ncbi:hypothetical protein [Nostoc sp. TCL26-01]|uniref:hypothetical protein n=1 Tax=Nostoc sp. TCL26-01 TaxID=2576904 RepID=UPI0015BC144C|nr:hypothetical protein [Nostoc sp. TCL26-01]QLE55374.1 hypothetical protein FD725_07510 [Nostoc sp. TCL26-01]